MLLLVNDPFLGVMVAHAEDCPTVELARGLNWPVVPLALVDGGVEVMAHVACALD